MDARTNTRTSLALASQTRTRARLLSLTGMAGSFRVDLSTHDGHCRSNNAASRLVQRRSGLDTERSGNDHNMQQWRFQGRRM